MRRFLSIILVIIVGALLFFGSRWYTYVTNTTSPYDEVGIDLNVLMPAPLRAWGCAQLQKNFVGAVPPYGCATGDGTDWI